MAESIKLIIKTNPATINVGANIPVSIGKDSSFNPAIQFKATGSSGNKGDTGLTGLAGATYIHPTNHAISVITGLQTALNGKVNISQVLTNVPANALFTDTNINTQLPLIDSDAMTGASATNVASAESVKAYVDSSVIANTDTQDLSISGQTLSLTNGGSVTLPDTNTQLPLIDSDTMSGASATNVASSESIKAYVDGAVIANTDTQDLSISGQTLSLTSGGSVTLPDTNTQLDNAGVIGKVLTGLNVGTTADVAAADTIVVAIGKLENRVATNDDKATDVNHNVTTNLSVSTSVTTVIVNSSDGTNATIPVATTSIGGVMSKAIFDEHTANVAKNTNVSTDLGITGDTGARVITSSDGTNATIPVATTSVSGLLTPGLFDEIDANTAKTSNIVQTTITGNAGTATALTSGDKTISGDLTVTGNDIKDSGGNSIISSDGSGVVTMAGGNINIDGSNSNFNFNNGADILLGADVAGGTTSTIQYLDSGSTGRYMLMAEATDKVVLCNRASNGTVYIRANTSTAGGGGEVTVATFEDDKVTISQDLDVTGNVLPGITYIKILPRDFIADDGGRPLAIDDTGSDRWLESHDTYPMFASVEIPAGFKATHVDVYGDGTSAVTVYEADINAKAVTSKGTGNIGTQINITDVTSDATNYLLIQLVQTSGEQVNGGKVTIAKV